MKIQIYRTKELLYNKCSSMIVQSRQDSPYRYIEPENCYTINAVVCTKQARFSTRSQQSYRFERYDNLRLWMHGQTSSKTRIIAESAKKAQMLYKIGTWHALGVLDSVSSIPAEPEEWTLKRPGVFQVEHHAGWHAAWDRSSQRFNPEEVGHHLRVH